MEDIQINSHRFEKVNLITKNSGRQYYDEYTCKDCGLSGKRYGFSDYIRVKKGKKCTFQPNAPSKIIITTCNAVGPQFENLTPNSMHEVVSPPDGYENNSNGVWVMGVGEPVMVLHNEFKIL